MGRWETHRRELPFIVGYTSRMHEAAWSQLAINCAVNNHLPIVRNLQGEVDQHDGTQLKSYLASQVDKQRLQTATTDQQLESSQELVNPCTLPMTHLSPCLLHSYLIEPGAVCVRVRTNCPVMRVPHHLMACHTHVYGCCPLLAFAHHATPPCPGRVSAPWSPFTM